MDVVAHRYPWERLVYPLGSEPYRNRKGWVTPRAALYPAVLPLQAYEDSPVIVLLGERGVGKSDILAVEARRLAEDGTDSVFLDLGDPGADATAGVTTTLKSLRGDVPRFAFLDSLDEAIDNDRGTVPMLAGCLRDLKAEDRALLRLRIACRSSRWPDRLRRTLDTLWPDAVSYLGVAGLTRDDVLAAAQLKGLDASFVQELEQRRLVVPLASWPVTLGPLLDSATQGKPLPRNTAEAFSVACERLCTETNPAFRDGITADHPSTSDLLAAGRRVAAAIQFGPENALADLTDEGPGLAITTLARGTEPDGAGRVVACTEHLLRKLTESALLSPLGPRRWGFAHRSFQEFLATQYFLTHRTPSQVRQAVLLVGEGPGRHVVDSQREVAAWLSGYDDELFEEVLAHDPEVLLLADPALRQEDDRRRLTGALLELARTDYTVQLDPLLLYKLDYPQLAKQIASRLEAGRLPNERYAALMIARACPQPALAGQLLNIAEDPDLSDSFRTLAIEAVTIDSDDTRDRLLQLLNSGLPDIAGAALRRLWPEHMTTATMLASLPEPHSARIATGWAFIRAIPEMLQPHDLADVLTWASTKSRDIHHPDHADLLARALAWAVRTCEQREDPAKGSPAPDSDVIAPFAEALIGLAHNQSADELDRHLGELGAELAAHAAFRRAVARRLLEVAAADDLWYLSFGSPVHLFPAEEDLAYWASQLPSLLAGEAEKLEVPFRQLPATYGEWAQVWKLAQDNALVRQMTAHWYLVPWNQPPPSRPRRRPPSAQDDAAYNEETLKTRLAELTETGDLSAAGDVARRAWTEAVYQLQRTADGNSATFELSLDLSIAPSYPPPGSGLHALLLRAASAVLTRAPVISANQIDPRRISLLHVPELWALSLLTQAGAGYPAELDADRWTGITLALAFVPTAPGDHDLRGQMLVAGLAHASAQIQQQLPGLLDYLAEGWLTVVVDRLAPALTPALAAALDRWAVTPGRDLGKREAILDGLVKHGCDDILARVRQSLSLGSQRDAPDPASIPGMQWLSDAMIAVRHDTAASLPVIVTAITVAPALAPPFLDRLALEADSGNWQADMSSASTQDLATLCELATRLTPTPSPTPTGSSSDTFISPPQPMARLASRVANIIASRSTREAALCLRQLSEQYPDHWQFRELARMASRRAAEQEWQSLGLDELLRLADNSALRLAHDERHLSDIVVESLNRLQHLLLSPNGWVTLLWHKEKMDATTGWWPAWEEDLSDLIATFLQYDLVSHQVIVNREVQIHRPGLDGQRTDIHVQAYPASPATPQETLTVVIECKGCWNSDLKNGLSTQLVAKYLSAPGRIAGIYLIGYFDNPHWDHAKHQGREHTAHNLDDLRTEQNNIARVETSRKSAAAIALVLDCRLPGVPPTSNARRRPKRARPS